jgi:hypothetical protein
MEFQNSLASVPPAGIVLKLPAGSLSRRVKDSVQSSFLRMGDFENDPVGWAGPIMVGFMVLRL